MPSATSNTVLPATALSDPWSGVGISLAFWLTLVVAAGLFAAVSLSPKLAAHQALQEKYCAQQRELLQLEQQQTELERVISALQDDPQFAAELARLEFDAVRPGEEILSVESSLALDPHSRTAKQMQPVVDRAPFNAWIVLLAEHRSLRTGLLFTAGVLVLLAFGWFQETSAGRVRSHLLGIRQHLGACWRRYVPPPTGLDD